MKKPGPKTSWESIPKECHPIPTVCMSIQAVQVEHTNGRVRGAQTMAHSVDSVSVYNVKQD
jgi:hypothetical protein